MSVAVFVGVLVGVWVGVCVGVFVGVFVGVLVGVTVGVLVGVFVAVAVAVLVGVLVFVGVGVGVTIALSWTLRSWFAEPPPSRFCVRMWKGEPLIPVAPLPVPQYELLATCPAQSSSTVDLQPGLPQEFAVKVTVMSDSLLAVSDPVWVTAEIDTMLPL